jgi:hypothetical protein
MCGHVWFTLFQGKWNSSTATLESLTFVLPHWYIWVRWTQCIFLYIYKHNSCIHRLFFLKDNSPRETPEVLGAAPRVWTLGGSLPASGLCHCAMSSLAIHRLLTTNYIFIQSWLHREHQMIHRKSQENSRNILVERCLYRILATGKELNLIIH